MKNAKVLLLFMFILPWLTLPLMGSRAVKRFLPAGIFISIVVSLESILAKKRKWWWYYEKLHPKLPGGFPLTWGPFFIGSMWILRLTYGKFYTYMVSNLIIDTFFTYLFTELLKKQGIASLVKMKKCQLSLLFFFKSLLLYGFQRLIENKNFFN